MYVCSILPETSAKWVTGMEGSALAVCNISKAATVALGRGGGGGGGESSPLPLDNRTMFFCLEFGTDASASRSC